MAMREKALSTKTLVSLIQGLEGKTTTIDFRDETSVTGKVDSVDGYMNVEMKDVTYVAASGVSQTFSKYCCQGKFIRYVHIPDEVDPIEAIRDRLEILSRMKVGRGGRGGRGGRRGGRGGGRRGGGGRGGGGRGGGGGYGSRPSYGSSRGGGGGYGGSSGGGGGYGSYGRRY